MSDSSNNSVPDRRPNVAALPVRAEQSMSRRQKQIVFEQVKTQVMDIGNRYFDLSLRVLKRWISSDGH